MSKPKCENCYDTGRSFKGLSNSLDCAQCDAAIERTALESEFPVAARECPHTIWAVHQRARRIERESIEKGCSNG